MEEERIALMKKHGLPVSMSAGSASPKRLSDSFQL
jgi:hypothetical protein